MDVKRGSAGIGFRVFVTGSALAAGSLLIAVAWELSGMKSDRNPNPVFFMLMSAGLCMFWPAVLVALVGLAFALAGRGRRRGAPPSGQDAQPPAEAPDAEPPAAAGRRGT